MRRAPVEKKPSRSSSGAAYKVLPKVATAALAAIATLVLFQTKQRMSELRQEQAPAAVAVAPEELREDSPARAASAVRRARPAAESAGEVPAPAEGSAAGAASPAARLFAAPLDARAKVLPAAAPRADGLSGVGVAADGVPVGSTGRTFWDQVMAASNASPSELSAAMPIAPRSESADSSPEPAPADPGAAGSSEVDNQARLSVEGEAAAAPASRRGRSSLASGRGASAGRAGGTGRGLSSGRGAGGAGGGGRSLGGGSGAGGGQAVARGGTGARGSGASTAFSGGGAGGNASFGHPTGTTGRPGYAALGQLRQVDGASAGAAGGGAEAAASSLDRPWSGGAGRSGTVGGPGDAGGAGGGEPLVWRPGPGSRDASEVAADQEALLPDAIEEPLGVEVTPWKSLVDKAGTLLKRAGQLLSVSAVTVFVGKQLAKTAFGAGAGLAMIASGTAMASAAAALAGAAAVLGSIILLKHKQKLQGAVITVSAIALTISAIKAAQGNQAAYRDFKSVEGRALLAAARTARQGMSFTSIFNRESLSAMRAGANLFIGDTRAGSIMNAGFGLYDGVTGLAAGGGAMASLKAGLGLAQTWQGIAPTGGKTGEILRTALTGAQIATDMWRPRGTVTTREELKNAPRPDDPAAAPAPAAPATAAATAPAPASATPAPLEPLPSRPLAALVPLMGAFPSVSPSALGTPVPAPAPAAPAAPSFDLPPGAPLDLTKLGTWSTALPAPPPPPPGPVPAANAAIGALFPIQGNLFGPAAPAGPRFNVDFTGTAPAQPFSRLGANLFAAPALPGLPPPAPTLAAQEFTLFRPAPPSAFQSTTLFGAPNGAPAPLNASLNALGQTPSFLPSASKPLFGAFAPAVNAAPPSYAGSATLPVLAATPITGISMASLPGTIVPVASLTTVQQSYVRNDTRADPRVQSRVERRAAGEQPFEWERRNPGYAEHVETYAQKYGVPEAMLRTQITMESNGNPTVKSPVCECYGLGQVSVGAGNDMARRIVREDPGLAARLGIRNGVTPELLKNPEVNIALSARYTKWLADNYTNGDYRLAALGYNWGPAYVSRPPHRWPAETREYYATVDLALKRSGQ